MTETEHLQEELARCREELSRARAARGEHQLEQLFTLSLDMICIAGTDGYFRRINPAFTEVLGWTTEELLSRPFLDYVHPDDIQKTLAEVTRLSQGEPTVSFENRYRCADGSWKPLAWKTMPAPDGSLYAVARDMTAHRQAIRQREAELARSAHQQGRIEMSAGILHDLGNAMTGIGSRATTVRDDLRSREALQNLANTIAYLQQNLPALTEALGPQRADALILMLDAIRDTETGTRAHALQHIEKLLGAVRHAADLLATHRNYSQAGSAPRLERLSIDELFRDASLLIEDGIRRRHGRLILQVEPELPTLHIERSKALQVLLNLLKNAAESFDEAAPPVSAPEITLIGRRVDGALLLEVADNGPGFEPGDAERLFEPQYSTKRRGSGIGLSSVRRVARSLGGTVQLMSPGPGRGARATITLPIQSDECSDV